MKEELKYYLALNKIPGMTALKFQRLIEHFGRPSVVWNASDEELREIPKLKQEFIDEIIRKREEIDPEEELKEIEREGIKAITIEDEEYPENLKNIYDPPPVLYFKGEIKKEDKNAISIVGSRRATYYGIDVAKNLAKGLAERGFTIVSGMARGIDTSAHWGALEAKGRTIAVFGCGLNIIYPRENKNLAEEIIRNGAIISEFPIGVPPLALNFPIRNRIISGLSLGVVIVQAGEKSGATITAEFALEQGREVFAVPGNVNLEQSKGSHKLIKQGAKLTEDINDILEELGIPTIRYKEEQEIITLPPAEQAVYNCLNFEGVQMEEIVENCNLPVSVIASSLLMLEMKGLVRQLPGKIYLKVK
jgi:DNA processing protein